MNLFISGDLHGRSESIRNFYRNYIKDTPKEQEENWIICLGDFGAQFFFDYRDRNFKKELSKYPFKYFVIRGNHEQRASIIAEEADRPGIWEEIECFENSCLRETDYPNIYYALDEGGIYNIEGRKTLVIPGGYSVDKHYRLMNHWTWFPNEQLTEKEMADLDALATGQHFDLILSHTIATRYQPTDLFLNCIDQSKVDNTMEQWMDQLHDKITFGVWLFAHYHTDRVEAPYVEIFYNEIENLTSIEDRWKRYDENGKELDWWIPRSPNFNYFKEAL